MLSLPASDRLYLCTAPADMRNYAVTVIMRSRDALDAVGGDRACVGVETGTQLVLWMSWPVERLGTTFAA
jgi:hypothetical protein